MGKILELDKAFDEYFNEIEGFGMRCERFYAEFEHMVMSKQIDSEPMIKWLRAAFYAGARAMAQDTLDTLGDYGTAVAGVDQPKRNPTECFDSARDNLHDYFTQILQKVEND